MKVDDPKQRPRNVLPDLVIPLLALAFTGYYLTTITEVPWIAQASAVVVRNLHGKSVGLRSISGVVREPAVVGQHDITTRSIIANKGNFFLTSMQSGIEPMPFVADESFYVFDCIGSHCYSPFCAFQLNVITW